MYVTPVTSSNLEFRSNFNSSSFTPADDFAPGCYVNPGPQVDIEYSGPIDTVDNARYDASTNGPCDGFDLGPFSIVRAPDHAAAIAKCVGLGLPSSASNLLDIGYVDMPGDVWTCNDN